MKTQTKQPQNTQGITKKRSNNQHHPKTDNNNKLLSPKAGYNQHASLLSEPHYKTKEN